MFRIECFCDDKSLAKLLWALSELGAYNVTNQPVAAHTVSVKYAKPKRANGPDALRAEGHEPPPPERAKKTVTPALARSRKKAVKAMTAAVRQRAQEKQETLALKFAAYVKDHKLRELSVDDVRAFVTTAGYSVGSYTYILSRLQKAGVVSANIGSTQGGSYKPTISKSLRDKARRAAQGGTKKTREERPEAETTEASG